MTDKKWMIYGAYGYTGALVVEEAVKRGHRPVLAGRSREKLAPIAEKFALESRILNLNDHEVLTRALEDVDLVFHAAGPYVHTSAPMVDACLKSKTHYLDVTGETSVFEHTLSLDEKAKAAEVALISGTGFDVVPSDCLANYVAKKVENPTHLELGVAALNGLSPGTTKTALEHMHQGAFIRRNGKLENIKMGSDVRQIRYNDRERLCTANTWGDLVTAHASTGIPSITVYMAFPKKQIEQMRRFGGLGQKLLAITPIRRLAQKWVEKNVYGPNAKIRETARCHLWAKVWNENGDSAEAWLETMEAYQLTAVASLLSIEKVLTGGIIGAITPAQAFGANFVMEIAGTKRMDELAE